MNEVPRPPSRPNVSMKCQYAVFCVSTNRFLKVASGSLTCRDAHQENAQYKRDAASQDQEPWSILIEDWTNKDPTPEGQEDIDAKDPTNCGLAVVSQLMRGDVCLVDPDGVHVAKASKHAAK